MRNRGAAARIAVALLIALAVCAPSIFANAAAGASRGPVVAVPSAPGPGDPADAISFWTPKRMREAVPLELRRGGLPPAGRARPRAAGRPTLVAPAPPHSATRPHLHPGRVRSGASASAQGTDTGDPTIYPNRVNGQVFFSVGRNLFSCSGSVINTPTHSTVLTAGHCAIDPTSGVPSTRIVFVPGYRDGASPFGVWGASSIETASGWMRSVSAGVPNEGVDLGAFQVAPNQAGQGIQDVVGSFGIGFNQARDQIYTEYGYPGVGPYDGNKLYSVTSPHTGDDLTFVPPTIQIQSDFTQGASGGPYVVGGSTMLSVDAYGYSDDPIHNYGPYFGSAAQFFYEGIAGFPFQIRRVILKPRAGRAFLVVHVSGAGAVLAFGRLVKRTRRSVGRARNLLVPIDPTGAARRRLARTGRAQVAVIVANLRSGVAVPRTRTLTLIQR